MTEDVFCRQMNPRSVLVNRSGGRCGVEETMTPVTRNLGYRLLRVLPLLWCGGTFSYGGAADIIILPEGPTVTKDVYLRLLDSNFAKCFAATGAEVLPGYGAPYDIATVAKFWPCASEVECIPNWPSSSPDHSPSENL